MAAGSETPNITYLKISVLASVSINASLFPVVPDVHRVARPLSPDTYDRTPNRGIESTSAASLQGAGRHLAELLLSAPCRRTIRLTSIDPVTVRGSLYDRTYGDRHRYFPASFTATAAQSITLTASPVLVRRCDCGEGSVTVRACRTQFT